MSEFRGSRKLMLREKQARNVRETNRRRHTFSPQEAMLRAALNEQARQGFVLDTIRLVKQAPKHDG